VDNLSDDLAAWDAASLRRRERSLREQALWSTTLPGLFLDAAERGAPVAVVLRGGAGTRTGVVTVVGADYIGLGDTVLLPFSAIAAVRGAVSGDRDGPADGLSFAAAVGALAEEGAEVSTLLDCGESVTGVLRAAADSMVLVDTTWVALDAVRALQLVVV